jgi:hypothetical protein
VTVKYVPWNFQCLLPELRAAIQASNPRPVPIFLLDSPRTFYVEGYHSIGEYLRLDFAAGRDFDMFSEVPAGPKFVPAPESPLAVFRDPCATPISAGALLIGQNFSQAQLRQWSTAGRLIYVTSRPRWLHIMSLDSAIQSAKTQIKSGLGTSESVESTTGDYCLLVAT